MTLQEIITTADEDYPNTKTDTWKCGVLDRLQRRLYRKFDLPEAVEYITTVANLAAYNLPDYVIPDRIEGVIVTESTGANPQEYDLTKIGKQLSGNCYMTMDTRSGGILILYPEPTVTGYLIMITFKDGPNLLSVSDLNTVPRLFKDYHGIFINWLKAEMARDRDIDKANNFQALYDEEVKEAIHDMDDAGPFLSNDEW
jgi:hypothetical protein